MVKLFRTVLNTYSHFITGLLLIPCEVGVFNFFMLDDSKWIRHTVLEGSFFNYCSDQIDLYTDLFRVC